MSDEVSANDQPAVIDAGPLHEIVDQLAQALHDYVDTSVGVRAEFDAATADDDPRVEAAEARLERLNAMLDDAFESQLGMTSAHTWVADDDDEDEDDESGSSRVDTEESLHVEIVIDTESISAEQMDAGLLRAMAALDEAARQVVSQLEADGITVNGWTSVHEYYIEASDDDE